MEIILPDIVRQDRRKGRTNAFWGDRYHATMIESGAHLWRCLVYTGRPMSAAEQLRHAHYMAVMRFVLADKDNRLFITERFCFKGSIDDWIYVDGPAELSAQSGKYIKHLGQESFYELF